MDNSFDEAVEAVLAVFPDAEIIEDEPGAPAIEATYDYVDEAGALLFQVVRRPPKKFVQRRPDGNGGWRYDLEGVRRVLFRLPKLRDAIEAGETVFVVEGEKDVAAIEAAGGVATCNPGGALKWRDEFSFAFEGAHRVVIVADRDEPGRRHARAVKESLDVVVADRIPIVEPLVGKDAADHLAGGFGLDDFVPIDEPAEPAVPTPAARSPLPIESVDVVASQIAARQPRRYLLRPIWPEGDYGAISGEDKAGKSWLTLDACVSVASGTPWLGVFDVDAPGPVLLFAGEGGAAKTLRRLRAVCAARGLTLEDLPVRVCFRVPHVADRGHLDAMRAELDAHPAALIVVDPGYLAMRGGKASQLVDMGERLEAVQHVAQEAGAALAVTFHYRKDRSERGRWRISGVGPGAWGRVLVSADVEQRRTDGRASVVTLGLEIIGDEIEESRIRIRRRVWTDADDLDAPMHYTVERLDVEDIPLPGDADAKPSVRRVHAILDAARGSLTVRAIGDRLATDGNGPPLKRRTIQAAPDELRRAGLAHPGGDPATGLEWAGIDNSDENGEENAL